MPPSEVSYFSLFKSNSPVVSSRASSKNNATPSAPAVEPPQYGSVTLDIPGWFSYDTPRAGQSPLPTQSIAKKSTFISKLEQLSEAATPKPSTASKLQFIESEKELQASIAKSQESLPRTPSKSSINSSASVDSTSDSRKSSRGKLPSTMAGYRLTSVKEAFSAEGLANHQQLLPIVHPARALF